MSRLQTCVREVRYCAVSLILLFACGSVLTAQVDQPNQEAPIQIRLRPDKKTIMLGEPMFIAFEVTNVSGEKLCLGVGGDYRNRFGRPDRFQVSVRTDAGAEVPQLEAPTFGGFVGCDPIEAGETYTVRLLLSHWATIERTGAYRVNVKRQMGFRGYDSPGSKAPKYSFLADVNAEFVVVASEENKVGGIINSLGSVMLDSSDPRAADSALALASMQDKRVISYFAEALRRFEDFEFGSFHFEEFKIISRAIAALAIYDDDRAIEALQGAMNRRDESTRYYVALAFRESPHRSALKLLLKMQDDKDSSVRRAVAYGLEKPKTKESLTALQKLLNDKDESVRDAAKESLTKIKH